MHSVLHGRREREEVEIVGFPVAQVIAGQGAPAGQEETALLLEERLE
jgi:hypothetical protein